ncbi:uncharacterized protein IL334_006973 [Kwoniella shivajii]|uniref:NAD-dependent protein deacetylase n=1 Tax=Kwoniella shivajii TaxID=564305 RepID=A0ABZ1D9H2_9TREE|nr:hypothetical protein IL334_006973 [Kwoniella shivajii]
MRRAHLHPLHSLQAEPGLEEDESVESLKRVAELISSGKAKNICLLLGAGISTSAGIPDFRSPNTGLYHNLQKLNLPFPEAVFELNFFNRNPEPFWTLAKELYPGKHFPTPTHYFLPLLHRHGLLKRVFTQNIDTLETLAGLPPDIIVEAHGSFANSHCLRCRREVDRDEVLKAGVRRGEVVRCSGNIKKKGKGEHACGGLVKPDIVFFGEGLPDRFFRLIPELKQCDLLLVIGTSLQVQPFASLVDRVPATCPRLLINREPVGPFSNLPSTRPTGFTKNLDKILHQESTGHNIGHESRDMYWEGDADEGISRIIDQLGWRDEFEELIENGKKQLEKQYEDAERLESQMEKKEAHTAEKKAKKGTEAVKEIVGEKTEGEDLEEAIRRQLRL